MLREEAREALPALRAAAQDPATQAEIRQIIGARFVTFPQPDRSQEEWAAWWEDYYDALADVPAAALDAAMRAYVRQPDSEFLPKPGKLLELSRTTPNKAARAYGRAQRACSYEAPQTPRGPVAQAERAPPTDAERAAVARLLEDFKVKSMEARPKRVETPMPSTAGKPDAGGLTPQMRDLMARRSGDA